MVPYVKSNRCYIPNLGILDCKLSSKQSFELNTTHSFRLPASVTIHHLQDNLPSIAVVVTPDACNRIYGEIHIGDCKSLYGDRLFVMKLLDEEDNSIDVGKLTHRTKFVKPEYNSIEDQLEVTLPLLPEKIRVYRRFTVSRDIIECICYLILCVFVVVFFWLVFWVGPYIFPSPRRKH